MKTIFFSQSLRSKIKNVFFLGSLFFIVPIFVITAYPIIYLPESWRFRSNWYYLCNSMLARTLLFFSGIKLNICGKKYFEEKTSQQAIIVLNHQSCIDAWVSEALLGPKQRIMFSNNYSHIPLLGSMLKRMNIIVARTTARSSIEAIHRATELAKKYKSHIIIFPEGTRHTDGNVHTFYRGFTIMAEQLNLPVIPIFLHGFHKIIPKGAALFQTNKREVIVKIGEKFHFDTSKETREEFLEKVHNWFKLESCRVNQNN